MNNQRYLIFVIETNVLSRTDNTYINKYLSIHHAIKMQSGLLTVRYVYMAGKTKYDSKEVTTELNGYLRLAKANGIEASVIYCFDTDRLNKNDKKLMKKVEEYLKEKGFEFVLFNPKIEPLFGVKDYKDKVSAAKRFKTMSVTKQTLNINTFNASIEYVYGHKFSSNLEIVLTKLLKD